MSGIIGGAGSKSGVIGQTELDYEEGEWTPTNSNTLTTADGYYTKIGRHVFCTFHIVVGGSSPLSGDMGGLPFTRIDATGGAVGYHNHNTTTMNASLESVGGTGWSFRTGSTQIWPSAGKMVKGSMQFVTS